jgi:hypothetical protein
MYVMLLRLLNEGTFKPIAKLFRIYFKQCVKYLVKHEKCLMSYIYYNAFFNAAHNEFQITQYPGLYGWCPVSFHTSSDWSK